MRIILIKILKIMPNYLKTLLITALLFLSYEIFASEVNVYTSRHYDADDLLYEEFTQMTGIRVNIISGSGGALMQRLKAEGKNSPGDVFFTVDAGNLEKFQSEGFLQSINSPKILQLSGIGNEKHLKNLGIEVINNLVGVGENLQDHLEMYIQYKSKKNETLHTLATNFLYQAIEGSKWFLFKKGRLAHSHLELGGFVKSDKSYNHPNLQFHFFPYLVINHGLENPNFEAFQFHVCPNRPKSRGFVKIKTNNYKDDPKIQFNYLKHEDDLKQMREGVVIAKKILSQKALKEYVGTEIRPGKNISNQNELDEVIKNTSESAYHPSCTNKMGEDKTSVVDQDLRVHGIQNLRVVDASVMPDIVSANLNATTIMIAEKAYDQINSTVS